MQNGKFESNDGFRQYESGQLVNQDIHAIRAAKAAAEKQIMEVLENFHRRTSLTPLGVEVETTSHSHIGSIRPTVYITRVSLCVEPI